MATNSSSSAGAAGCPCVDETATLASLVERSCQTPDGSEGVLLTAEGPCVLPSYGSQYCLQHDLIHDPDCSLGGGNNIIPAYCTKPWCYVDAETCTRASDERIYRSTYFPREDGVDVYWSYTACDPSYDDWERVQPPQTLGGITLTAAIPIYYPPFMHKVNSAGEILPFTEMGSEYYNSSDPYEGALVEYLNSLVNIADGDFNISYTHVSQASKRVHKTSSFTAAVQDIEDGLVDFAVGPFWITGERLQMTSYTVPLYYDRTLLVIKNPGKKSSLSTETQKVLDPFDYGVWLLILGLILTTALLSVWFAGQSRVSSRQERARTARFAQHPTRRLTKLEYARLAVDEFLHNGIFFCSAGVEQEKDASLAQKLLLFGFSFFVLIVVSAYVANLAAFLTRDMNGYVGTMEDIVENGISICAYSALRNELQVAWPAARFVFSETASDFSGVFEDYDAGKCTVMAIPHTEMSPNTKLIAGLCERDLVFTKSLVIENPVSLPIRPELVNGLSYWMYNGEKNHGITLKNSLERYFQLHQEEASCSLEFSAQEHDEGEYAKISVDNLLFPIVFFACFAAAAIASQLYHQWMMKKGAKRSLAGRTSTFAMSMRRMSMRSMMKDDSEDDLPQSVVSFGRLKRRSTVMSDDDNGDELNRNGGLDVSDTVQLNGPLDLSDTMKMEAAAEVQDATSQLGEDFHDAVDEEHIGPDPRNNATSRLQALVEDGAFDEILECVEQMKRLKES